MGRVVAVLKQSNPFADFVRAFAPIAMQEMEERRKQEENAMLGKMYLDAYRAPADAAVAPYQQNAIQSQDDAFRKQMVAESSAMTDSLMANNPNFTQRIQGQTAPVTPEQAPALQQQFQQTNQANLSQANNQAQSAEQMLAMAKEKYGTAMFDRLAPIVASGKVPAQAMISIIERQIQTAEKTALKQAQNQAYKQAMELMKQGKVDEAKMLIAEYASPDAQGRLFASIGQGGMPPTISPGQGYFDKATGKYVVPIPKVEKPDNTVQWGPVQYDPQGRAYQVSNRNEIRPLANYDKPPKDTGLGNLSAEEVAQKKELKDLISTYEKRFPAPGGGFNPEKAEMNDPEGYKKYQDYLKQHGELSERALQPKTKPAKTSSVGDPLLDATIASIRMNGAESAQSKLAARFGPEKAKQIMAQASLFLQENQ